MNKKESTNIILLSMLFIFIIAYHFYAYTKLKQKEFEYFNKIHGITLKINKLDSLNFVMDKKDSALNYRIDSVKANYATKKKKYEKTKDDFNGSRTTIGELPNF